MLYEVRQNIGVVISHLKDISLKLEIRESADYLLKNCISLGARLKPNAAAVVVVQDRPSD